MPHLPTVRNSVGVRVVRGQQDRPVDAPAAAPAGERADHDQVDGVGQLGAVVPLELDPLPAAGAGPIARVGPVDLHISPSQPSATACSNAASSASGVLTSAAVVSRSRSDRVSAAASRSRRCG